MTVGGSQVHPVLAERGNVPASGPRTLVKPRMNELARRNGTGRVPQAKRFCIRIKRQPHEEAAPANIAPLEPEELKDALLMQAIAQRRALVNASLRPGTGREVKRAQFNIAIVPRARPQPLCFDSPLEENVVASVEPAAPTTTSRLAHLAKTPAGLRQYYPSPMEGIPERLSGGQRGPAVASTAAYAGAAAAGQAGRPAPQGFTPVEGLSEMRQTYLPARKPTPQHAQQQGAVVEEDVDSGTLPSARGSNQQTKQVAPVAAEKGGDERLLAQEDELRLEYELEMERQQRTLQAQHEEELQRRQEELQAQYEALQAQHEELQHQHEELQHHKQGDSSGGDGLDESPVEGLVQEHAGGDGSSVPPPSSGGPEPMFDFPAPPLSVAPSSADGSLPSGRALLFPSPLHRTEMGMQTGASLAGSAEKEAVFGGAGDDYDDDDFGGGGGYDDGGWGGPEDDDGNEGFTAAAADAVAMPPPPPRLKAPRRAVMNPGINLRKQLPRRSLSANPQVGRQEVAPGVRRTTRKGVEPLKWWLNEAKIYDRVAHKTMPTVTEMTHTEPNTPWRMVSDPDRFDYKGRPKGRGAKAAPVEGAGKKKKAGVGRKRKQAPQEPEQEGQEEEEEDAGPSMPPVDHSDEETELLPRSARKPAAVAAAAADASPGGWSDDEDAAEGPARVTPARAIDLTRTPVSEKPQASSGARSGEQEESGGDADGTMGVAGEEDAEEAGAAMDEVVVDGEGEGSPGGASEVKLARTTRLGKRKKKKGGKGKGR